MKDKIEDKIEEIKILEELERSLDFTPTTKSLKDFSNEDQEIIKGIYLVFEKYVKKMNFLNVIFILMKLTKFLSIVFLALLVFGILDNFWLVIVALILNPILSYTFKSKLYSNFHLHKRVIQMLDSIGLTINEFLDIADREL